MNSQNLLTHLPSAKILYSILNMNFLCKIFGTFYILTDGGTTNIEKEKYCLITPFSLPFILQLVLLIKYYIKIIIININKILQ